MSSFSSTEGSMRSLWKSIENVSESMSEISRSSSSSSSSLLSSSYESSAKSVNWMITNRGGFAIVAGLLMVPSQFLGYDDSTSLEIVEKATKRAEENTAGIESFNLSIDENSSVNGIIYYPKSWDLKDNFRCVFYSNPNGITIPGYFDENYDLSFTPKDLAKIYKCPIVMFDYRGTGLSQDSESISSSKFRPTYASIAQDGLAALQHALKKFKSVEVWGSSLGGGVATVALDRHLEKYPEDEKKVKLYNHDSFSTTAQVVMPNAPKTANTIGWLTGGLLDAQTPMKKLIDRGIHVIILCHSEDPVIPKGARMIEYVDSLAKTALNVSKMISPDYGHANLSSDMLEYLHKIE